MEYHISWVEAVLSRNPRWLCFSWLQQGCLGQGSPDSGPQTGTSCQISSGIRLEIKCIIHIMCLNHPKTIPSTPRPWKNCLSWNRSLVHKRLETTGLGNQKQQQQTQVCIPGPHLKLTESQRPAWKVSRIEIFPGGSERQLQDLNMLDDQTRIHRDFNRLEEYATKDNTCDAEVS